MPPINWPRVPSDVTEDRLEAWRQVLVETAQRSDTARKAAIVDMAGNMKWWNLFALASTMIRRGEADHEALLASARFIFPDAGREG